VNLVHVPQPQPTHLATLADKVKWCDLVAKSDIIPDAYRNKPANVLVAVEYGDSPD